MDLNSLNAEQRRAVETTEGPVLILAGAGSGKTRALTHRVAYLMEEKLVSPYEIMALTFTNKAAREMKERVLDLAGPGGDKVWISTFHAACAKMLRIDIEKLNGFTRDFVIYDSDDQLGIISDVQKELKVSDETMPRRVLRSLFSDAKNRDPDPLRYIAQTGNVRAELEMEAFRRYDAALRRNNALDFDDLLIRTLELFEKAPDVLEKYQSRFRYIHVDEYQDTNQPQYRIVQQLSRLHRNLCVVGDDDQSIYGWRGADIRNILGFEQDYPDASVIRLEQNYRSTKTILDAANAVIARNVGRKSKKLWTELGTGDKIELYDAWSERDEADAICRRINRMSDDRSYGDFAVLYRTNAQARVLEDTFVAYGIPYTVYGATRFYDRKEIKDVLAYLRLMVNPHDELSLRRAINTPRRGIGDASIAELERMASEAGISTFDACLQAETLALTPRVKGKVRKFGELLAQLRAMSELMPLQDFVPALLDLIGYYAYLEEEKRAEGKEEERKENVQEFLAAIKAFALENPDLTLRDYLENVALVANVNEETGNASVTLMTLHSAKGLEFPVVFIAGLEDGLFPGLRAIMSEDGMEEERRLCYVGITRAKEKLLLSHARSRMQYNNVMRNNPSRFLKEIPEELMETHDNTQDGGSVQRLSSGASVPREALVGTPGMAPRFGRSTTTVSKEKTSLGGSNFSPRTPKEQNAFAFALYQTVEHAKFGRGQITAIESGVLTIDFAEAGVKKIAATFAPLKPVE